LTFCEEHIPPENHDCLAVAEEKGQKRSRNIQIVEVVLFALLAFVIWWLVNRQ
jgi:predicted nucleic acid-binding Zn ribbon protein